MLDHLKKFVEAHNSGNERLAFAMGYDCEVNGPNERNCHFSLFAKPEYTKAWEDGKKQAQTEANRQA